MKKILLVLILIMPMAMMAKEYELYCSVGDVSTGGPFFEDDSVRFEFSYTSLYPHFLKVKVINKTDKRITVEWENVRLSDDPICFRTDNLYSFNNPKPDEVIHAKSSSTKEIGERETPEYRSRMFSELLIKNHGESVKSVILPIRYSSGMVADYKVYVCLRYKL